MGTYYMFVNDETEERVDPFQIGGGGIKWGAIIYGDAAHIFMFLVMNASKGTWRVISDDSSVRRPDPGPPRPDAWWPEYHECSRLYADITKQTIDDYNDGIEPERRIAWREKPG